MFLKLLKQEFKSVGKWYLGLYGLTLLLGVGMGWSMHNIQNNDSMFLYGSSDILSLVIILSFGITIATLGISTLVLIIRRFNQNLFGREGYLTLTLPVSTHQILLSKLVAALIWSLLSVLTIIVTFLIIIGLLVLLSGENIHIDWNILFEKANWGNVLLFLLYLFTNLISSTLHIYLSIAFGQLFENHRALIAFAFYFGLSILLGVLPITNGQMGANLVFISVNETYSFLPSILVDIVMGTAFYFSTYYILKNKVNLQ